MMGQTNDSNPLLKSLLVTSRLFAALLITVHSYMIKR